MKDALDKKLEKYPWAVECIMKALIKIVRGECEEKPKDGRPSDDVKLYRPAKQQGGGGEEGRPSLLPLAFPVTVALITNCAYLGILLVILAMAVWFTVRIWRKGGTK